LLPAHPPYAPWYPVPVRQATISLSLLLAQTSRFEPWESLWGSSLVTPLVDSHHRLTACPSYSQKKETVSAVSFLNPPHTLSGDQHAGLANGLTAGSLFRSNVHCKGAKEKYSCIVCGGGSETTPAQGYRGGRPLRCLRWDCSLPGQRRFCRPSWRSRRWRF